MMRVITGTAKGCRLQTPPGMETRPTSAKVKEAVFSAIQFEVEGANVLDLFAGSGQMGIEALSRGARFCVFVDSSRPSQEALRANLTHTGLKDKARVAGADARGYLRSLSGPFDIAFLDPPYKKGLLPDILGKLSPLMSGSGIIVCEHPVDSDLPGTAGDLPLYRQYRYGKTAVSIYCKAMEQD